MKTGPEAAVAVLVEWEGVTAEQYDEMINRMSVADVSLPGGLFHVAGPIENGWRVFDVWESPEVLERFTREILMPILEETGFPLPQVWTWPVYNTLSPPTEEVRASRLRIIAVQNAERRKLARDLHDGAQQSLIGLKIKLGLAATPAGQDPAKAEDLLHELAADADRSHRSDRRPARPKPLVTRVIGVFDPHRQPSSDSCPSFRVRNAHPIGHRNGSSPIGSCARRDSNLRELWLRRWESRTGTPTGTPGG